MARLILKSPFIKGGTRAVNYAKYIGTRERVELVPDGRPATKKQEQLIAGLVDDFPDAKKLPEYSDYHNSPTKVNASAFITRALEDNWDGVQQSDIYAEYIATRPRVERFGSHGLFGDEDYVNLKKVTAELQNCEKNVWTHIVSLKREDAVRLGCDNDKSWRNLLRAHRNDIAAAMNIPSNDFRWYAAFHDEGDHPHIHMMAWSAGDAPGYLSKVGIRDIKSALTNDIFIRKCSMSTSRINRWSAHRCPSRKNSEPSTMLLSKRQFSWGNLPLRARVLRKVTSRMMRSKPSMCIGSSGQ